MLQLTQMQLQTLKSHTLYLKPSTPSQHIYPINEVLKLLDPPLNPKPTNQNPRALRIKPLVPQFKQMQLQTFRSHNHQTSYLKPTAPNATAWPKLRKFQTLGAQPPFPPHFTQNPKPLRNFDANSSTSNARMCTHKCG